MARRSGRHSKSSAVVQVHCTARTDKLREVLIYADALGSDQSGLSSSFYVQRNAISLLACRVPGMQQAMLMKMICPLASLQVAELTLHIRLAICEKPGLL